MERRAVQKTRVTAEAFDHFIGLPENRDRLFELVGGEIVEVVSNNYASELGILIGSLILMFVRQHGLGRVTGADGGYRVSGERYIPDAAFISLAKQPKPSRAAYNPLPPDLAVEVLSPGNEPGEMRIKIVNYLNAGTVVWLVDPDKVQIEVYAPNEPVKVLKLDDTLDGGAVLPGFSLPLREIFTVEDVE
jgi:Uma2 family endonuclease